MSEWTTVADEPKPESKPAEPAKEPESATSISPAPTEVAGDVKAGGGNANPPPPDASQKVQAEPLSDGTTPTVLAPGASHRSVPKSKASITSVYRKADVLTTLYTFIGVIIAGGIILGAYIYFTRAKAPAPTVTPKSTKLDQAELDKLSSFFEGNSAGSSSQILTISSSSLFKNRVAVSSDLKVVGGVQVSGTTALGDLTVDKVSTLGVTGVRGSLTVAGPANFQGPALLANGLSVTGNVTATGNGTFNGSLSSGVINVRDISVTGNLNLAGHLSMAGSDPTITTSAQMGSGASAGITGNDSAGTVTFHTGGPIPSSMQLVTITFRTAFPRTPKVVISPSNSNAGLLSFYVQKSAGFFIIATAGGATANTDYSFDYWVVQ